MRTTQRLQCSCGSVLVSDGVNWVCPRRGELVISFEGKVKKLKPHEGEVIHDARLTVNRSVTVRRPHSPAGFSGHRQGRLRSRVHNGSQRACLSCNPLTAPTWRAQAARLKSKGWKVSL